MPSVTHERGRRKIDGFRNHYITEGGAIFGPDLTGRSTGIMKYPTPVVDGRRLAVLYDERAKDFVGVDLAALMAAAFIEKSGGRTPAFADGNPLNCSLGNLTLPKAHTGRPKKEVASNAAE